MVIRAVVRSLLTLALAGCALVAPAASALAQGNTLNVGAGVGSRTIAGNVYAPGELTVHVGDSVTWTINSDEPHTITFGQGPANAPPPNWPVAGFTPPPASPGPPKPVKLGPVDYPGTGLVNSGLLLHGSTATIHFITAGDFNFLCAIHPGMAGVVHVVAASQASTSQAEADAKASATQSAILGQVDALQSRTQDQVTKTRLANGTTRWNVFTNAIQKPGPRPGGGTGYLELLQFIPASLSITAGDTVQWTATAVHTVTFVPAGKDPKDLGDPFAVPPAKPSSSYDGKSLYNSGLLAAGPGAPTTFSLTFPNPGTYSYVCLIHDELGQKGTIQVAEVAGLPKTGDGPTWALVAVGLLGAVTVATGIGLSYRSVRRAE